MYNNHPKTDYNNHPKTDYNNHPKTDYNNHPKTDNASVCSDDTDLLLSTSCNFKDIQGSYLSKSPDTYSMTAKYINENSNDVKLLSERVQSYDYDSGKSRFTNFRDINRQVSVSLNHIEIPKQHTSLTSVLKNSLNKGLQPNVFGSTEGVKKTSETSDEKCPTGNNISGHYVRPVRPASNLKNYVSPPKAANSLLSSNYGTPSKCVTFEDSLGCDASSNNNDMKQHCHDFPLESKQHCHDFPLESSKNMYNTSGDEKKEDEFDMIDEKVREGKEILKRLLTSTELKKPSVPKTFLRKDCHHETGTTTLDNSDKEGDGTLMYDRDYSNDIIEELSIHTKDLKDPIFMSTRLDNMSDERSPMKYQNEVPLTKDKRSPMKYQNEASLTRDVEDNQHLVSELKELKEELSKYQVNSFHEVKSLREDNEKVVTKLHAQLTSVHRHKETLEDYVNQLKGSLSKKNERCSELQEQLHEKLTIIHQVTTAESEERHKLENEVNTLHDRKKTLEEQMEKMENSFQEQFDEIKEVERRFQSEKEISTDMLKKKDKDIALLRRQIELLSEENNVKQVDLKSEMEIQVEKAMLRGKSLSQSHVNEIKLSLDNEVERHLRLESKHQVEVKHLKANFETFKAVNTRLKKELDVCLEQNRQLEKDNLESRKKVRDEAELEGDLLKKKIIGYEKIQRSMALELIEESTKLAVVCGTSPSTSRMSSQDAFVDCNVMSEAMSVFKEHLEAFRHHVLTLSHNKQKFESNDENSLPPINVQTSAKLLRHLQNRVQQLRKENAMLRENSVCESCQGEIKDHIVNGVGEIKDHISNSGEINHTSNSSEINHTVNSSEIKHIVNSSEINYQGEINNPLEKQTILPAEEHLASTKQLKDISSNINVETVPKC